MSDIEDRISKAESKIAMIEREFNNSWAYGSRSEYEERFKQQIANQLSAKSLIWIATGVSTIGAAAFFYIGIIVESKVNSKVDEKIEIVQKNEENRINKIMDSFDWRQSHDFGYVYRNLAQVFWEDKSIDDEDKKRWIAQLLKLASEKLLKAKEKGAVRGATYWELGNLAYTLPVKYDTNTKDSSLAEKYFKKAVELYEPSEIEKGWRGGAYEDLAKVQVALSLLHKGTNKGLSYKEKAVSSKKRALHDYKEIVDKSLPWLNESISRLEKELGI